MNENFDIKIRTVTEHDRTLFIKLFSDIKIMKYIGQPMQESEINAHFDGLLKKLDMNKFWLDVIDLVFHNNKVNSVGILQMIKENDEGRTGIMILREYHGKNIAIRAKKLFLEKITKSNICFKVIAYCNANNVGVNKLYDRLDFNLVTSKGSDNVQVNKWEKQLMIDK